MGIELKRKISITLVVVIILGLGALGTWLYLKPTDSSEFSGLVRDLKSNGYKVKDVTNKYGNKETISAYSQKILDVNGERLYVISGNAETIQGILQKNMSVMTNPLVHFIKMPHLYYKNYLVVTYIGDDKGLLKTLEEVLGKSLVN